LPLTDNGNGKDKRSPRGKGPFAWGALLLVLLSKAKVVLLFLLKLGQPLWTMLVTVGIYALVYPWQFAVGFVALILVHELGHVWVARRKGLPVSLPFFIPFLGALVMLRRHPKNAATEAAIALGGPVAGSLAALLIYGIGAWTGAEMWYALAYVGFFLNLINLLPFHMLDGGRIAAAVSRWLWLVGAVVGPIVIWFTGSLLFLLLWIWFLWEMYRRFIRARKEAPRHYAEGVYRAKTDESLPDWYFAGERHHRSLPYTAYCRMDGQHVVEFRWEPLDFRGELAIDQPIVIRDVRLTRVEKPDRDGMVTFAVRAEGSVHEPENYYEVPAAVRWKFGTAYGILVFGLLYLMWRIQTSGVLERGGF